MRFEYLEDQNSHHVLIGREGKLTRCGDVPIRVPGTVPDFGVLMVLHDDHTTGKLPIRGKSLVKRIKPISISSRIAILFLHQGISSASTAPRLHHHQAKMTTSGTPLQVLDEPDSDSEDEDGVPQLFLVSG